MTEWTLFVKYTPQIYFLLGNPNPALHCRVWDGGGATTRGDCELVAPSRTNVYGVFILYLLRFVADIDLLLIHISPYAFLDNKLVM